MTGGKRWTVRDRDGNEVYLTEERWQHIVDPRNHPEMKLYEEALQQTIQTGRRRQDALNPRKYRFSKWFGGLPEDNTHIVAIVLFGVASDELGRVTSNHYVVTAYQKEVMGDE